MVMELQLNTPLQLHPTPTHCPILLLSLRGWMIGRVAVVTSYSVWKGCNFLLPPYTKTTRTL